MTEKITAGIFLAFMGWEDSRGKTVSIRKILLFFAGSLICTALKIKEYLFHLINWIAELLPDTNNRPVLCEVYLVLSLLHELNIPQAPIETLMRNSLSQITGY